MISLDNMAVNGWYFRNDKPVDIVRMIRSAGFSACEFTGRQLLEQDRGDLKKLKAAALEYDVEIKAVNSACDGFQAIFGNYISEEKRIREERIRHVCRCIDACALLDVPRLVTDLGTTFLYGQQNDRQEALFRESIAVVRQYAEKSGIGLCLIIIPYRRVLNSANGFYFSDYKTRDLLEQCVQAAGGKTGWVFDVANEMAGCRNMHNFSLVERVKPYLEHGLDIVYLANHPGPMTRTSRRALYHDYLRTGCYTGDDYRALLTFLQRSGYKGNVTLHLSVKNPDLDELRRERRFLERL